MGAYDPTAWGVEFLSTLSLRRATNIGQYFDVIVDISIR